MIEVGSSFMTSSKQIDGNCSHDPDQRLLSENLRPGTYSHYVSVEVLSYDPYDTYLDNHVKEISSSIVNLPMITGSSKRWAMDDTSFPAEY
ncbi:hypothetical protein Tco_1120592 [Tanacetum coccineum]